MEFQKDADTNLFTGVDFQAFWETLRLRWWIIPTVLAVSVGFLWAQASESRIEPEVYFVTRTYEARDPTAVLASVGIDPVSVRAFPDAANQLLVLQSSDVRQEISDQLGRSVNITVTRSRPSFTLIDTLESDGQSSFVFQSAGVPTYTFSCYEPELDICERGIDAYAAKAVELRRSAFQAGLTDLREVLNSLHQQHDDPSVDIKISAIDLLIERLQTPLTEIASRTEVVGPTISFVRRPTYMFGLGAGLVISLLILLQLTVTDRRLRSARQVINVVGSTAFIGSISSESHPTRDLLAGVSLRQACLRSTAERIKFVPLSEPTESNSLKRLAEICDMSSWTTKPFGSLTVSEILIDDERDIAIVVAQRNRDLRQDLRTAFSTLQRSGQRFGGVLLLE